MRSLVVALALLLAIPAHADDAPVSRKRALPDYDGLPDPGVTAGEVLAWVPRVVLFPPWVVWEFVLRRPLGWLIVTGEKNAWPSEILSFFTFGGRQGVGLVPTFYVDLGFRPSAGFYFFWDGLLHPRHGIRLRAQVWDNSYALSFADRWRFGPAGSRLQIRGEASRHDDLSFYGAGPRTLDADLVRYGEILFVAEVAYDLQLGHGEHVRVTAGVHDVDFFESDCCSGGQVEDLPVAPVGYPSGYTAWTERLDATFDTREMWPGRQNGVRAAVFVEHGTAAGDLGAWIKAGGTIGAFWDVVGMDRVIGVSVSASALGRLRGEVPFTELIDFAGGPALVGFRPGRLVGESGASAALRYEWPVWAALAGSFQVELGNAFGRGFEGLEPGLLRLSTAFGLRSMGPLDHQLQMVLGIGTETFDQGAALTSVRLAIGGTFGF